MVGVTCCQSVCELWDYYHWLTGHRSLKRDLEIQVAVVTENAGLRHSLHKVSGT